MGAGGVQGVLSWVAQPQPGTEPASVEARLYEPLFKSANPSELGDAWLDDLNPDSLSVIPHALVPPRLANAHVGDRCSPIPLQPLLHRLDLAHGRPERGCRGMQPTNSGRQMCVSGWHTSLACVRQRRHASRPVLTLLFHIPFLPAIQGGKLPPPYRIPQTSSRCHAG